MDAEKARVEEEGNRRLEEARARLSELSKSFVSSASAAFNAIAGFTILETTETEAVTQNLAQATATVHVDAESELLNVTLDVPMSWRVSEDGVSRGTIGPMRGRVSRKRGDSKIGNPVSFQYVFAGPTITSPRCYVDPAALRSQIVQTIKSL